MPKIVDKMGITLRKSQWESCGKVSTFLTDSKNYFRNLWEMFGFSHSFATFFTMISTEFLFGFTGVRRVNLHIYT